MKQPDIGKAIKIGRVNKGISQKELAKIMGVTSGAVSSWEQNVNIPPGDVLIKLAHLLEILPLLFLDYTEQFAGVRESDAIYFSAKKMSASKTTEEEIEELKREVGKLKETLGDIKNALEEKGKKKDKKKDKKK